MEKGKEGEIANMLVTLSTQLLTPLLRCDLSVGERLAEQVFVALVILHELGVTFLSITLSSRGELELTKQHSTL
jgi:hypothetical protein